jgi:ABC-type multidrug transport system ATPase subunit
MSELMISNITNNFVDDCSGGEFKRLAVASELISYRKPNLLCIDEPMTGLDSNAAEIVSFIDITNTKDYKKYNKYHIRLTFENLFHNFMSNTIIESILA